LRFGFFLVTLQASQRISTPFSTVPLLILANVLVEPFAIIIVEGCHVFQEKNPHGNEENEVSLTWWHFTPHSIVWGN
jgi:hypothetical protein